MVLAAGATFAAAVAVLVFLLAISTGSNGQVSVLIGTMGSSRIGTVAVVAALTSLAVGLCLIPVSRIWLLVMVPARLAAIAAACLAGFVWVLTSSATVVPLISAGCETGYVIEEDSFLLAGWGTVYRTDGIFATAVERTGGDDGYHPFADGAYAVAGDGDALPVWYSSSFDYLAAPTATDGEPAFTLPTRTDRAFSCGLSAGTREPSPTPPPRPVYTADEARAGVAEMVAASLAATAWSARNATGAIIDAQELELVTTACGEDGTRVGVGIEFTTDDNAASLARILQVWDAAGYSPDRAMQEDIRYSGTLPVEKTSIRDSTTIDGLIRMGISSRCSAPE